MQHAWYSAKMAERTGTVFYRRENGEEVEVTSVSDDAACPLMWDDAEYRGVVVAWVRKGRYAAWACNPGPQKMRWREPGRSYFEDQPWYGKVKAMVEQDRVPAPATEDGDDAE